MEEDLISKKDLLELTGISYGQLYRWKRKYIIPEEWFIKKSSYTGQETYFPKEKILDRIEKIKNMKDGLSPDELADFFSTVPTKVEISKGEVENIIGVSKIAVDTYESVNSHIDSYNFNSALTVYILEKVLKSGETTLEEGKELCRILSDIDIIPNKYNIVLLRKFGVGVWVIGIVEEIKVDSATKVAVNLDLNELIEELKLKLENIQL